MTISVLCKDRNVCYIFMKEIFHKVVQILYFSMMIW